MNICPNCYREHKGACDTRSLEDRRAAQRAAEAARIAKQIAEEQKRNKK